MLACLINFSWFVNKRPTVTLSVVATTITNIFSTPLLNVHRLFRSHLDKRKGVIGAVFVSTDIPLMSMAGEARIAHARHVRVYLH